MKYIHPILFIPSLTKISKKGEGSSLQTRLNSKLALIHLLTLWEKQIPQPKQSVFYALLNSSRATNEKEFLSSFFDLAIQAEDDPVSCQIGQRFIELVLLSFAFDFESLFSYFKSFKVFFFLKFLFLKFLSF